MYAVCAYMVCICIRNIYDFIFVCKRENDEQKKTDFPKTLGFCKGLAAVHGETSAKIKGK